MINSVGFCSFSIILQVFLFGCFFLATFFLVTQPVINYGRSWSVR